MFKLTGRLPINVGHVWSLCLRASHFSYEPMAVLLKQAIPKFLLRNKVVWLQFKIPLPVSVVCQAVGAIIYHW